ncbi:MAG: hypothetical protein ABL901_13685 [Hyphomicrobiaceae bacterium]
MPVFLKRSVLSGLLAGCAVAGAGLAMAAEKPDCFSTLRHPGGKRLVCEHKAWMTDEERADIAKLTRGYLLDAKCVVSVDVERGLIDEGLAASDRVFDLPAQPVVCALETSRGPMTIAGTFAPKVTFKDGFAVDASPGLGNVTGVNSYLAWPVVAYVNSASRIKSEMASMINMFRARLNKRQGLFGLTR